MPQHRSRARRKYLPWWRQPINNKILETKFGIFGTRGGVLLLMALIGGLIATPWLLWFLVISAALGVLFAFFNLFRSRSEPNLSIVDDGDSRKESE